LLEIGETLTDAVDTRLVTGLHSRCKLRPKITFLLGSPLQDHSRLLDCRVGNILLLSIQVESLRKALFGVGVVEIA
jgi:hypothetical protein